MPKRGAAVSVRLWFTVLVALAPGLLLCFPLPSSAQARNEYEVKAAFIYNFAKFVEWPVNTLPQGQAVLNICVFGQDPFGRGLEDLVNGKVVDDRKLQLLRVHDAQHARACQILFISFSEKERAQPILQSLAGVQVLTVGESEEFARAGGIINFVLQQDRVRFEINVDAADRARVKLSSKLLNVASIVRDAPPARTN